MEKRHKILLLDDDADLLDMYREILSQLPSQPEIRIASTGARAMAMLDGRDLPAPHLRPENAEDGRPPGAVDRPPQVSGVCARSCSRRWRTSSSVRAFTPWAWISTGRSPAPSRRSRCSSIASSRCSAASPTAGFRGVQSKSLVDIIQLECISQSSSVLRITNGPLTGKIWINNGELIDAETDGARAEEAFQTDPLLEGRQF